MEKKSYRWQRLSNMQQMHVARLGATTISRFFSAVLVLRLLQHRNITMSTLNARGVAKRREPAHDVRVLWGDLQLAR